MKEKEIDDILRKAAGAPQCVDPLVAARIGASIKSSMRPVRAVPPAWLMTIGLVLVCAGVSLAGAAHAGFFGLAKMDLLERLLVFPALGILMWLAAGSFVAQMIPASGSASHPVRCWRSAAPHCLPYLRLCSATTTSIISFRQASRASSPDFSMPSPRDC